MPLGRTPPRVRDESRGRRGQVHPYRCWVGRAIEVVGFDCGRVEIGGEERAKPVILEPMIESSGTAEEAKQWKLRLDPVYGNSH